MGEETGGVHANQPPHGPSQADSSASAAYHYTTLSYPIYIYKRYDLSLLHRDIYTRPKRPSQGDQGIILPARVGKGSQRLYV